MLNSKQLIEITGISRATLNNYVALGILPSPVVKAPVGEAGRATRLGYFDDEAVDSIKKVQDMKKHGMSMSQIAEQLGGKKRPTSAPEPEATKSAPKEERGSLMGLSIESTIDNFPGPAYMVNNNFELIWWNDSAADSFFSGQDNLPGDLEARNLLKLIFESSAADDEDKLTELLRPHIAVGKKRLSQQALIKIYSSLSGEQLDVLKKLYDEADSIGKEPMIHFPMIMDSDGERPVHCDLYICFYREGILFTFSPVILDDDYLLEFLSKRNLVINELLKKRKPYLTNVSVMVADVQNSIKICSELPAEEYFELINDIWQQSEPIFRKYYGTYGKHAGDGMVYYFFPQPDCDYRLNAIKCSLELQEMMKGITKQWQSKKGWFSDIYLNIGLNEGQEWFGSYHAGGHVEFTVLGETINYAARISDFARSGAVWVTKSMLNQISSIARKAINFGITRRTMSNETVFVTDSYANIGSLLNENTEVNGKFRDIEMIPITEVRDIDFEVCEELSLPSPSERK
jgi:class 3 adenylate cyclase/DNA-binding transcriptional MerR regulator